MIFLITLTLCRSTHLCTYVAYLLYLPRHSLYWEDLHQTSGSHHFSTPNTRNELRNFSQCWLDRDTEYSAHEAANNEDGKGRIYCLRALKPASASVIFGCYDLIWSINQNGRYTMVVKILCREWKCIKLEVQRRAGGFGKSGSLSINDSQNGTIFTLCSAMVY